MQRSTAYELREYSLSKKFVRGRPHVFTREVKPFEISRLIAKQYWRSTSIIGRYQQRMIDKRTTTGEI